MKKISGLLNFKKLKTKVLFGFSIIMLLVVLLSGFTIYSINSVNNDLDIVLDREIELMIADEGLAKNMLDRTRLIQGYILFGNEAYKEAFEAGLEESIALENRAAELSSSAELESLLERKIEWGYLTDEIIEAYEKGNVDEAGVILETSLEPLGGELIDGFGNLAEATEQRIQVIGEEIQQNVNTLMTFGIVISLAVIVLGITIAMFTAQIITNPIQTVMKRMKLIASGHLNNERLTVDMRDEIGQLVSAANDMNDNMRDIMVKITDVSHTVSAHSEELTQSAYEVRSGTEQITSTMEELASGAETQAYQSGDLSNMMSNFTEQIEEVNRNAAHVQKESNQVLEMTNEGSVLMDSSTNQMESIDAMVQATVKKVEGLDEQTQEISKLVTVIQDIAAQTNLLALNAAIEAARAGENGRGFAVVADEVGKLAAQVGSSVTDISGIVYNIQTEFSEVTTELNQGYEEVKEGTIQIQNTGEKFTSIRESVTDMVGNMQKISDNVSEFAASSQKMNSSIQEIAAVSEESAAGIEQTSASSEQTSSSMEEVAKSATELARLAENLNELVNQFQV
ncbi:methyl-accepting chemotaxis protein [Oceanobacillus indicireducens]|uniref:Sensory transducer protein YvaQ n=1 Tax=Oceanobacillus indicireducens TaxID=1004261 RepID=A0A917Y156_9BACI|nr:methyl-accepting chemotaxis protein [Oceanobacillus indicireducens]GGN63359.1 putative sensory transducer protein YvaQ [Oceanobacillus indicireducens]